MPTVLDTIVTLVDTRRTEQSRCSVETNPVARVDASGQAARP